jgi:dTDP-4-dehydrorhamnose reductase
MRFGLKTTMTSQDIKSILSHKHSTPAKRPVNSRLNMTKIKNTFMLEFPDWKDEVVAMLKVYLINT